MIFFISALLMLNSIDNSKYICYNRIERRTTCLERYIMSLNQENIQSLVSYKRQFAFFLAFCFICVLCTYRDIVLFIYWLD